MNDKRPHARARRCSPSARRTRYSAGFRQVGVRERLGAHRGRWRDVVLLERRSSLVADSRDALR